MRYPILLVWAFLCILLNSCKQTQDNSYSTNIDLIADSIAESATNASDITYFIPSPHQVSLLIKDNCPYFDENIFKKIDINLYSTTEKKALVLGALGADVGYLSLYDQREKAIQYLDNIRKLLNSSDLESIKENILFTRIEDNLEKSDSILAIISEIFRIENKSISLGERPHLSILIAAGGWVESFFILNKLYYNTKNSNLFGLLLQQQYSLSNIINLLRPYYAKSIEFTNLTDRLVEIAYEFEVVDVNYNNHPSESNDSITLVNCRFTPVLTGSHLDKMFELSGALRNSIIN